MESSESNPKFAKGFNPGWFLRNIEAVKPLASYEYYRAATIVGVGDSPVPEESYNKENLLCFNEHGEITGFQYSFLYIINEEDDENEHIYAFWGFFGYMLFLKRDFDKSNDIYQKAFILSGHEDSHEKRFNDGVKYLKSRID